MFTVAKLVGASSPTGWSQVHTFVPDKKKQRYGRLVAAVGVKSEAGGVNLPAFGAEAIQRLHESYYGETKGEGLKRLIAAIEKVEREFREAGVSLGVSAGVVVESEDQKWVVYAVAWGEARVMLYRGGRLVELISPKMSGRGVSGWLQVGDKVVWSTEALFGLVGEESLEQELKRDVVEAVDRLAPRVHAQDSSLVAAVFGGLKDEKSDEPAVVAKRITPEEREDKGEASVRLTVAGWMRGMWERLGRMGRRRRGIDEVYVGLAPELKRRRVIGTVAMLLAILLIVSVGFGVVRQRTSREARVWKETQSQVERLIKESESLRELNPLRSRALLTEAQELLRVYREEEGAYKKAEVWAKETEVELTKRLSELLRLYEARAEVWLDLGLIREGSEGRKMDFDGKELVVLDEADEVVLAVEVKGKKAGVVGGGELLKGASAVAVYFGRGFVVADRGIVELTLRGKTAAVVIDKDEEWGEIGEIDVYGGNLYLVDKEKGKIYRYAGVEGGFGALKDWLGQGMTPDFSKVVAVAIDGSIWVLTSTGKIERYTQGTGVAVEIMGLDVAFKDPEAIYTDEESERVYILDRGNKRVVVAKKSGEYEAQYRAEEIGMATDMVVADPSTGSGQGGKILLLGGSMIYEIPLENF